MFIFNLIVIKVITSSLILITFKLSNILFSRISLYYLVLIINLNDTISIFVFFTIRRFDSYISRFTTIT